MGTPTEPRTDQAVCSEAEEAETAEVSEDYDPTPWCLGCGAMTEDRCDCGPICDNN